MSALALAVAFVVLSIVVWVVALRVKRVETGVVRRGLRNGLLVTLIIIVVVSVMSAISLNGSTFVFSRLSLRDAIGLGLLLGGAIAAAYLWIGSTFLALGLLLRGGKRWATIGTWFAPLGVGLVVVIGIQAKTLSELPRISQGNVSIEVVGERLGTVTASGPASCNIYAGRLTLRAGTEVGRQDLVSAAGGPIGLALSMRTPEQPGIHVRIGDQRASVGYYIPTPQATPYPGRLTLVTGSTQQSGQGSFTDLAPQPATNSGASGERWHGTISWQCR